MGKRRPENYEQDHRIYTGLYTAKAFNMLKDMLPSVVEEWGSVVPIRDVNGETVLVTRSNKWERSSVDSCREWMLDNIQSSFSYALGNVAANAEERFVLSRFLIRGENSLTDEQKKILEKLRGVPRDVITSELNVCLAEEEARIEKEYAAFAGQLERFNEMTSPGYWFGTYIPTPTAVPRRGMEKPDFYPADMTEKLMKAEAECVEAYNAFASGVSGYSKAYAKYRSILVDAKKLNTKIKNDRIKALRREFAAAKRTSK